MKTIRILILLILLIVGVSMLAYSQSYKFAFSSGIPISNNQFKKYEIGFSGQIETVKNLFVGVECNYTNVDVPNSSPEYFMFDRRVFNSFVIFQYVIDLTEKVAISPAISAGYAFVNYELSGFDSYMQNAEGVSLKPSFDIGYNLTNKTRMGLFYSYSKIYDNFKYPDLNVAVLNPFSDSVISNHCVGVSFAFILR